MAFEERRMRTETPPLGKFEESVNAMFWESHPYSWPVVGWPSDIPAISKAQADGSDGTYYVESRQRGADLVAVQGGQVVAALRALQQVGDPQIGHRPQ